MHWLLATVATMALSAGPLDIDGLREASGRAFHLSDWRDDRLVVVTFLGVECPLAGLYSLRLNELCEEFEPRGVRFLAVNSNAHDTFDEMAAFATRLKFPMLKDDDNRVADAFGATRSPEVFLLDADRQVIYRGRIDDQYAPGIHGRKQPTRRDLEIAISEALAGRPVSVPVTEPAGCVIDRTATPPAVAPPTSAAVTYAKDIAAIFDARCVECHRPGQAAPFSLETYEDALGWAQTIRQVIDERRMPPWHASGGPFANDRSLTDRQRGLILAWVDSGAAEGDPAQRPAPPKFTDDWTIRADRVLTMPTPFDVPAEGVLEYRQVALDPAFASDTWVQAVEIRPGNRAVVHHINAYLKPKGAQPNQVFLNPMGDYYLAMAVPGNSVTRFADGCAKLVPAGWNIVLEIHYVPNGTPQADRSTLALELADSATVRRQVATRAILDDALVIQPFEKKTVEHTWTLDDEYTLFALYPHMHWRGRSMKFTARYPDGATELLLDVDPYDFAWQFRYILATPRPLPRGTVITATAVYDNTAANPNNPDPSATIHAGPQTTDEMFQACLEVCRAHEDRIFAAHRHGLKIAWAFLGLATAFCIYRRWRVN